MQITEITTKDSFCSQETFLERSIIKEKGEVRIACIAPGGFKGNSATLAELSVQPLVAGDFSLRFGDDTKVLAHDGLGTDILRLAENANYQVVSDEAELNGTSSTRLLIFSKSHPNPERWYNERTVDFSWRHREGYTYRYLLDQNPDAKINNGSVASGDSLRLVVPKDGVYYLHIQAEKNKIPIGKAVTVKVQVDATPPQPPVIRVSGTTLNRGETARFEFTGEDKLSGLQSTFYVKFDDSIFLPVVPALNIAFPEEGNHVLTARAFDNAGNFSDSSVMISVH